MSLFDKLAKGDTIHAIKQWLPSTHRDVFYNEYKRPGIVKQEEFTDAQNLIIEKYDGGIKQELRNTFQYSCNCKVSSITLHNIAPGKQKPNSYNIPYEGGTLVVINTKNGEFLATKDSSGITYVDLEPYNWDQFIVVHLSI